MKPIILIAIAFAWLANISIAQESKRWFSFHEARSVLNFGNPTFDAHVIFPDTLVRSLEYNSQLMVENYPDQNRVRFHLIGEVFDPFASVFKETYGLNWSTQDPYKVDSISLGYIYVQNHPNGSITDTLLVYVYKGTPTNLLQFNMPDDGGQNGNNYAADTVKMRVPRYSSSSNGPNSLGVPMQLIKLPLGRFQETGPDEMNAFYKFGINEVSLDSGQQLVVVFGFKPGYTYTNGDTISRDKNYFCFVSQELYGPNTYPYYHETDYNLSHVITNYERYNQPLMGQPYFIPTYIWAFPWQYEQHRVRFHVKGKEVNTGLKEAESFTHDYFRIVKGQGMSTLLVSDELAEEGRIQILDSKGRLVSEQNYSNRRAEFRFSEMNSGVYFISIETPTVIRTQRFFHSNE